MTDTVRDYIDPGSGAPGIADAADLSGADAAMLKPPGAARGPPAELVARRAPKVRDPRAVPSADLDAADLDAADLDAADLDATEPREIDLNSDVGESFGNWTFGDDAAIIGAVSSVNVACGFHAGDPSTLRATCAAAAAAGVIVGAHPGYRDLAGFGRRFIDMDPGELTDDVIYQIGALQAIAAAAGTAVRYVKPHGALYNAIVHHPAQAAAVVAAVAAVDSRLPLLVLPGSEIERAAADAGLRTVAEAFADRAYTPGGTLVPRSQPGAVLHDERAVVDQVLLLATQHRVRAIDGTLVEVRAQSVCVHGDTPGAARMAAAIRASLGGAGIRLASFA